jgi:hypothetical protein
MQTPEQLASLRERGYCVLRGVIPPLALRSLNGVIDAQLTASPVPSAEQVERARSNVYSFSQPGEGRGEGDPGGMATHADTSRTFDMPTSGPEGRRAFWSAEHRSLIDPPEVLTLVSELCREDLSPPRHDRRGHTAPDVPAAQRGRVRLDFDQLHYKPSCRGPPDGGGGMHGHPDRWHITALYELSDVGPGDGGFACIPGSHRHSFQCRPRHCAAQLPELGILVRLRITADLQFQTVCIGV